MITVTPTILVLLFTSHPKAVSTPALDAETTEQLTPTTNNPVFYKCSNAKLPDELVLPPILLEGRMNAKWAEDSNFGSAVFIVQDSTSECANQLNLFLNLTNSGGAGDLCKYRIEPNGTFNIVDYVSLEYDPEHYCISRWDV